MFLQYKHLKKSATIFGVLLSVLSVYFVINLVLAHKEDFGAIWDAKHSGMAVALGVVVYAVSQLCAVVSWRALIHGAYLHLPFVIYFKIVGLSQIGKYIPGNVSHLIGRAYLSNQYGIKLKDLSFSLIAETVLLVISGVFIGTFYIVFYQVHHLVFVVLAYVLVIMLLWWVVKKNGFNWAERKGDYKVAFFVNCLSFFSLGVLMFVVQAHILDSDVALMKLVTVSSLAFVAGFLVPGSPAGIGVREGAMVVLLKNDMPMEQVLYLTLTLRLITLIGDVIMFLIAALTPSYREKTNG